MKFATIPVDDAAGAILAHSLQGRSGIIKKGRVLAADDVASLKAAGVAYVMAARLDGSDVPEDEAASTVAQAIAGDAVRVAQPFTGRCNLYAAAKGVLALDTSALDALNRLDEALTVATLAPFERVEPGQMIATIKVIPFAVAKPVVAEAARLAAGGLVSVAPFREKRAGVILTRLKNTKAGVLAKREQVMRDRLVSLGSTLDRCWTVDHDTDSVASAIAAAEQSGLDPIIVFAASAIVDRNDVIPAALVAAGGDVAHLGMPVDPGNLMMVGRLGSADVFGAPSCAGSPKLNGFDWVLERRLAGLAVGRDEIQAMGVGGLLKEIPTRPQPRDVPDDSARREKRIACIVLAAGRSTRMGPNNKLLEPLAGKPVIRHTVEAALASRARPVVVVSGHQSDAVEKALSGLDVRFVHNPDFASGIASSVKAGIAFLAADVDGAIVALGDMPEIEASHLDRMIAAFEPKEGRSIIAPVYQGKRGNPVLWDRRLFPEIEAISGDTGARSVLEANAESVVELDMASPAILLDLDTPDALAAARQRSSTRNQ